MAKQAVARGTANTSSKRYVCIICDPEHAFSTKAPLTAHVRAKIHQESKTDKEISSIGSKRHSVPGNRVGIRKKRT